MGTDKSAGFEDALEEADCHDGARIVHRGGHHRQPSPPQHHAGEEDSGPDIVQRQVRWDLADDITHGEARVDLVQLVADEAYLLLHARNVSIREVGAIELSWPRRQ